LPVEWADRLADGLRDECALVGATVAGGDIVRSDTLTIAVTALGDLEGRPPVTRAGARPGDLVMLIGWPGRAAAGLALLTAGDSGDPLADAHRRPRPDYAAALALAGAGAVTSMIDVSDGLLADLEEGWSHSVAFVVPPGTTWTLPLYELALMTARAVHGMNIDDARLQIVSPETTPLALFGEQASDAVAALLAKAGIEFRGDSYAHPGAEGALELLPAGDTLDAERVVALPTIEGPQVAGIPADDRGFIPIDEAGRVLGIDDVYAAGDGTSYPIK